MCLSLVDIFNINLFILNGQQNTYNQISDNDCCQKERNAWYVADKHAIPHRFDPFTAENAKNNHERMHEIGEIPSRQFTVRETIHIVWNICIPIIKIKYNLNGDPNFICLFLIIYRVDIAVMIEINIVDFSSLQIYIYVRIFYY